jgi:hypothetical protein
MAWPVIPPKDNSAKPRPRLGVVRSELRLRESRLGREPRRRLLAHPIERVEHYDRVDEDGRQLLPIKPVYFLDLET